MREYAALKDLERRKYVQEWGKHENNWIFTVCTRL